MKSYKMEYNSDIHYSDQYYTNKGAYYVTQNNNHTVISSDNELKAIRKDTDSTRHLILTRYILGGFTLKIVKLLTLYL